MRPSIAAVLTISAFASSCATSEKDLGLRSQLVRCDESFAEWRVEIEYSFQDVMSKRSDVVYLGRARSLKEQLTSPREREGDLIVLDPFEVWDLGLVFADVFAGEDSFPFQYQVYVAPHQSGVVTNDFDLHAYISWGKPNGDVGEYKQVFALGPIDHIGRRKISDGRFSILIRVTRTILPKCDPETPNP